MTDLENPNLGGVPEKFREEGVLVHYRGLAQIGDTLVAVSNVLDGVIPKGTEVIVEEISIEPIPNVRGFTRRIKLKGYGEQEFNPKRFKKLKKHE